MYFEIVLKFDWREDLKGVAIGRFLRRHDVCFSDDVIVSGWSSLRLAVDPDSVEHLWPEIGQS